MDYISTLKDHHDSYIIVTINYSIILFLKNDIVYLWGNTQIPNTEETEGKKRRL